MAVCCSWFGVSWIRSTWAFHQVTELVNELTPGQSESTVSLCYITPHCSSRQAIMYRIQLQHQWHATQWWNAGYTHVLLDSFTPPRGTKQDRGLEDHLEKLLSQSLWVPADQFVVSLFKNINTLEQVQNLSENIWPKWAVEATGVKGQKRKPWRRKWRSHPTQSIGKALPRRRNCISIEI